MLYADWDEIRPAASRELRDAEAAIVTSYCPDGVAATEIVLDAPGAARLLRSRYAGDAGPARCRRAVEAIGPRGLAPFDLVLSYTGGGALTALKSGSARAVSRRFTAASIRPRYRPGEPPPGRLAALSYLGTYAADRQDKLDALLLEPARRRPDWRFVIGGAQYPHGFRLVGKHLFLAARRAGRAPALLRGGARDAEHHPPVDGRERLVPVGQAVRGGGLRRARSSATGGTGSTRSSRPARKS